MLIPRIPRNELLSYPLEPYLTYWSSGAPARFWRKSSVPRIDDNILECVAYLYPSRKDAEEGKKYGGCGFWIGVEPSEEFKGKIWHTYLVTAAHVAGGGCLAVRMNTRGGAVDIIETPPGAWHFHPDGDDVAVCDFEIPLRNFKVRLLSDALLLNHSLIEKEKIGLGDDVVVVSRFMSHDGKQTNTPSVRYGNIAMMPQEPVKHPSGLLVESFLVECRSLGGASGSPVFVSIPLTDRLFSTRGKEKYSGGAGLWLLGVNWGHLHLNDSDFESILLGSGKPHPDGLKVRVNTGIMAVTPAWKIRELLDEPELRSRRLEEEEKFRREASESLSGLD